MVSASGGTLYIEFYKFMERLLLQIEISEIASFSLTFFREIDNIKKILLIDRRGEL